MKTLNDFAEIIYADAYEKGWHSEEESEDHYIERACNNLHDEVSELHEAWRKNKLHQLCDKADKMLENNIIPLTNLEEELADIIIRALDNGKKLKIDLDSVVWRKILFNRTREYRHGNKRS